MKTNEVKLSKRITAVFVLASYIMTSSQALLFAQEIKKEKDVLAQVSIPKKEKEEVMISAKDGGRVTLGEASIEIPEGALEKDTAISITRLNKVSDTGDSLYNATAKSGGYRFLPAGTKFLKDVTITLPYSKELNAKEQALSELYTYFYDTEKKQWIKLERLEVDKENCVVRSLSTHFTDMINATLTLPESASPVDVNLNSIKNLEAAKPDSHLIKFNQPKMSNMGDASFSFELGVPSGRRGIESSVCVNYSSGGGSGIMGKGFDVTYGSSVTTDTRFGLPGYDTRDTYMLDGIELKETSRRGTTITYSAQKESSFSRIVRYNAGSDSDCWEVTDKSGTKRIYAQNDSSCTGGGEKTFTWNVTKIEDVHKNNVIYEYEKSDGYVYPAVIYYTGFDEQKGNYSIKFHYDENGTKRQDVRIDARSKEIISCKRLLTGITTHYKNQEAIRTYSFNYTEGLAKEKMLDSLKVSNNAGESYEYTFDYVQPEKDGNGNTVYFAQAEEWKNGKAIRTGRSDSGGGSFNTSAGVGVGDINGTGDMRFTGGVQGSISNSHSETESTLSDINADGMADSIRIAGGTLYYRLNTADGFSDEENISIERIRLDAEESQNLSIGWNLYGGGGLNVPFVSGMGFSYSSVLQTTSSKSTASLSDIDGDRKTDIILSGKNYYLKNTSQNGKVSFKQTFYDLKNSVPVADNIKKLTADEINKYKETYKIQTPFRQWKSPYDGTLSVTQTLSSCSNNGNTNAVSAHVYRGNSDEEEKELLASVSGEITHDSKNHILNISQNENLYFITECDEPLDSDVNYNIDLSYESVKAYKPDILNPEFFPEKEISIYYNPKEDIPVEYIASTIIPKELKELYNVTSEHDDETTQNFVICTLKENWKEHASKEAFDYLIEHSRFLPGAFTEPQFEKILETFKTQYNSKDDYENFALFFIHDITGSRYELRDNTNTELFKLLYDRLNLKDIIKSSWKNYSQFNLDAEYDRNKIIYSQESDEFYTGVSRSKTAGGTQIENGNKIILGNLNNKTLSISKKDGKVFLDENEIQDFTFEIQEEPKENDTQIVVTLTHKINNEKLSYTLSAMQQKAHNITQEELQVIVDDFSVDGENLKDEYWKWNELEESKALSLMSDYGLNEGQQKEFLELGFLKTTKEFKVDDEITYETVYSLKEDLLESETEELEKILSDAKFKRITENDFPFYNLADNGEYILKDDYAGTVDEELKEYEKLLIEICRKYSLTKFSKVKIRIDYDPEGLYEISNNNFLTFRIQENAQEKIPTITQTLFSLNQTNWNSLYAWSQKPHEDEKPIFTGTNETAQTETAQIVTVKIERKEKLFAGNRNWFFGIWINGATPFTGKNIESLMSVKNSEDYENKYNKDELASLDETKILDKQGENEEQPFYIPLFNTRQTGSDIYPVSKESASGIGGLENSLIGQVSMSCQRTELADGSFRMETEYYFPFVKGDYIHADRTGGNTFYNIEGITTSTAKNSTNNSSFVFPNVRMSQNEGCDITFGMNSDTSYNADFDLTDTDKFNAGFSADIGGNTGRNENKGCLTQTVMDINGDCIPDIIQKSSSKINVIAGKKTDDGIRYYDRYEISGIDINSTSSSMTVQGSSFSSGGSVSLEFNKGKASHVKASAGTSGGNSITFVTGHSYVNSGFIDINGDGLPDFFNGNTVLINRGKEFSSLNEPDKISVPYRNLSSSSVKSKSLNISTGKTSTCGESISTGVSSGSGLSYSVSTNTTQEMFLDINGDGLADRLSQNGRNISVLYNTGNSFVKADDIALPSWKLNEDERQMLETGKDIDFDLKIFGDVPLIGPLTEKFVNFLPVFNPDAWETIGSMEFSSTVSLSVSGNIGVNFTFPIKVPVAAISVNMTCSGGNGLSGSSSINAVNVSMTDLDGDGLADHVLRIPGFATYWKRNISGRYGQLTKINIPQGGSVCLEYAEKYGTVDNPIFKYVLSTVTVDDGCGETVPEINHGEHSVTTKYEYTGAYYDRQKKDFYGFEKVTTTFADGTYTVSEYYNREYYSKGVLKVSSSYSADNTLLARSKTELCSSPYALPEKEESWTYEKTSGTTNVIHTSTIYEYDEYGNCTKVTQDFGDGERLVGKVEYDNSNVADYIIGLPVDICVYDANGNLLRHRAGKYNGFGELVELYQYFDSYNHSTNILSYDEYGNIKRVSDSRGATLSYVYDNQENMFVTEIAQSGKDTDTYKSYIDYDIAAQTKTSETDCNRNSMRYEYDGWQRITKIFTSYDNSVPAVSYEYFTPQKNADSFHDLWYAITSNKVTFDSEDDSVIKTVLQVDGLGRAVRTAKTGFVNGRNGWNASGAIEYDSKGRTIKEGMTEFIEGSLESLLNSKPKMTEFFTSYEYDEKDRQIKATLPDGSIQENSFYIEENVLVTKSVDPLGNVSLQETDSRGNIVRVAKFDESGKQLTQATYRYNAIGEMLKAFDAKGHPITAEYDLLGRRTALESPDSGRQEFFYDECSNLVRENNSVLRENNKQILYEYDGLNRLVKIDYPDTKDTVYTYGSANNENGAAGKILRVEDASGTLEYEYGSLGEVTKETRTLKTHLNGYNPTETAVMEYRSDYLGRMQYIVYPDGEKITYGYDAGGQVVSVTGTHWGHEFNYVTNILYDEYGQRTRIDYGNGTFTEYTYDPARRWLDTICTQNKWGQSYQNISYSFDAMGNVLGYENDCLDGASGNYKTKQTYSYDNLYQLIKVDGETTYNPYMSSVPEFKSDYSQVFEFDSDGLGNMVSKVSTETVSPQKSIGDNLNYSFDYVYDENFAHLLVRAGERYYQYDSNGNITAEQDGSFDDNSSDVSYYKINQETENVYSTDYGWGLFKEDVSNGEIKGTKYCRTYAWNEINQLISSVDSNYNTAYIYGQDGQRSNKYTASSETLYFNKMWTLHTDSGNSIYGGQSAKNIYLGETRIVTKLNSGNNPTYHEEYYKQYFYHSDHLGSASLISDYKGDEYQRIEYTPYGETWVEKTANTGLEFLPYKFTAKELDEETGLYYYGARYLDPKYSRWISTDPVLGEYIPGAGKGNAENCGSLPGMGGVFNTVNGNLYHYAGNNPVKYTDPDGRSIFSGLVKTIAGSVQAAIGTVGALLYGAGATVLVADDATVIGVADDPLAIVLAAGATASAFFAASGAKLASEGVIETADGVSDAAHNLIQNARTPAAEVSPNPLPPDDDDDNHKIGEHGTRVDSKTTWRNGKTERIDVENQKPGSRPGQIHYHDGKNKKYIYDIKNNYFYDAKTGQLAPNKVQNLLKNKDFVKGINSALKILGE